MCSDEVKQYGKLGPLTEYLVSIDCVGWNSWHKSPEDLGQIQPHSKW